MPIRKYGTEQAQVEVHPEDNDQVTLSALGAEELPKEIADTIDRMAHDPTFGVRRERPKRH